MTPSVTIVVALLSVLSGVQARAQGPGGSAKDLARAEQLFARSCASCHGPAGEGGKGPALAVPQLHRAPDRETLGTVIRRGIEGTEMPGTVFSTSPAVLSWRRCISSWGTTV